MSNTPLTLDRPTMLRIWDALARAEHEVFGDHLSFGTVAALLAAAVQCDDHDDE